MTDLAVVRTNDKLRQKNLTGYEQEVVSAEDFIVYGKASIEQFDDDIIPDKIRMEAFDEALPQFFAQGGVISLGHKDVRVGEAIESYELENPTEIQVDDESHIFDKGDTLETGVRDNELWLAANIYGKSDEAGSDASVQTRLDIAYGDMDGFSVTIKNKEYRETDKGRVITDIDFHSVTIGQSDQIKNPGSEFDLAEFKLDDIGLELDIHNMTNNIFARLLGKSEKALAVKTIETALSQGISVKEASQTINEEKAEQISQTAEQKLESLQEKAEDREDLVEQLVEMTDLDSDEINQALDSMMEDDDDNPDDNDSEEKGTHDDDVDEDPEMNEKELAEKASSLIDASEEEIMKAFDDLTSETEKKTDDDNPDVEQLVEEKLDERMDGVDQKLEEMQSKVADEVADSIESKMETGSTPETDNEPVEEDKVNILDL
jgi:hypothetical protein